jgi:hypothetical protein
MRVRAYGRRVSVVEVRMFCACARGERLLGLINIIIMQKPSTVSPLIKNRQARPCQRPHGCIVSRVSGQRTAWAQASDK